jgi:hypothetical protein
VLVSTTIVIYGVVLLLSGLVVALAAAIDAWSDRRDEVNDLTAQLTAAEQRNAQLRADLDRVAADHADAVRELGRCGADLARERHLRRAGGDLARRSLDREQERWADLTRRAVPEDRAGRYVPTPAEEAALEDIARHLLEES